MPKKIRQLKSTLKKAGSQGARMTHKYSMVIRWSDEDQTFIVSLPEFGPYAKTHGDTYEKAVRQGCDCLEMLIEAYKAEGRRLPAPRKHRGIVPA